MQRRLLLPAVLLVAFSFGGLFAAVPDDPADSTASSETSMNSGVAVVELFTSESCSSCPPADRLLRTLVEEARSDDRPLYALSFHVDYWNHLDWEDPYSDPAYSDRQRTYAEALDARVYTPQVIINGQEVLVGSREREVRSGIESALSTPASVTPSLQVQSDEMPTPVVHVAAPEAPEAAVVHVALVERGLVQSVAQGENAGRTLRHANVVRAFKTVSAKKGQTVALSAPSDFEPSKASVIAYVQDRRSMEVLGAARVDVRGAS